MGVHASPCPPTYDKFHCSLTKTNYMYRQIFQHEYCWTKVKYKQEMDVWSLNSNIIQRQYHLFIN